MTFRFGRNLIFHPGKLTDGGPTGNSRRSAKVYPELCLGCLDADIWGCWPNLSASRTSLRLKARTFSVELAVTAKLEFETLSVPDTEVIRAFETIAAEHETDRTAHLKWRVLDSVPMAGCVLQEARTNRELKGLLSLNAPVFRSAELELQTRQDQRAQLGLDDLTENVQRHHRQ